jgi:DNA-3-methyladenine glycosylase II
MIGDRKCSRQSPGYLMIIASEADIEEGLDHLAKSDRRLRKVIRVAGAVPLRRREGGLPGLARIIIGQQVSIASAEAIWGRFETAFPACAPQAIHAASDDALRAPGLSAAKIRTFRAVASACRDGLDLDALAEAPAEEAHARLTAIHGIGPWTADLYLLFCLGHADIFPAGDLALRNAVADAFGLEPPIAMGALAEMAERWAPWRGVAARLFWAYYRARRQKAAVPI